MPSVSDFNTDKLVMLDALSSLQMTYRWESMDASKWCQSVSQSVSQLGQSIMSSLKCAFRIRAKHAGAGVQVEIHSHRHPKSL